MLEILTKEWQYVDTEAANFENLLHLKEQRKLGTLRGPTSTPQAPVLRVRIKTDVPGLPASCSVKALLWSYGPAYVGKNRFERKEPAAVCDGEPLTQLRQHTYITCADNVEVLSEARADGYRYAVIRCFITRGARVCCRKNHIALKLCVVQTSVQCQEAKSMSGDQVVRCIPPIRTARLSISEKAMCPRYAQKRASRKRKLNGGDGRETEDAEANEDTLKDELHRVKYLKKMAAGGSPLHPILNILPLQSGKLFNQLDMGNANPFGLMLAQEAAIQLLRTQCINQNLLADAMNPSVYLNNLAIQACVNRSRNAINSNPTLDIISRLSQPHPQPKPQPQPAAQAD